MRIGVPKEIKNHEYRVAITPSGVHELARHGHEVFLEAGAGTGSSISDTEYVAAGATVLDKATDVWGEAELLLKVKEPIGAEYPQLREDLVLFTYLHLAADRPLTTALREAGTTALAYETVQADDGTLPLLAPMSEVAGRLAPQVGAAALLRPSGGRGVLPAGVPGVAPARVVVIGAGVAGRGAARIAVGLGADVDLLDTNLDRLRQVDREFTGRVRTLHSTALSVEHAVTQADLVVGAVLVPGAKAPTLVPHDLVPRLKPGSVLVDVSIDQGGCFADSRPTTHDDPTYRVGESVFYCVANMPGAVPRTSTYALTNATLPYVLRIAGSGWREAARADPALAHGLNTHAGALTNDAVAAAHGLPSGPSPF
ncbi:alanine dehydrogenase [Saccharomonospora piscinae]|uniref:alanine dehydrogenase n=1 Tax=Saccharomonospora piscinae TaxID=687388 RepID=UPI000464D95A|nr:alanine dehydrogenase [Saccharomonospora piscinae]